MKPIATVLLGFLLLYSCNTVKNTEPVAQTTDQKDISEKKTEVSDTVQSQSVPKTVILNGKEVKAASTTHSLSPSSSEVE